MRCTWTLALAGLLIAGCTNEPGSKTLTKGSLKIECDEAVAPVVQREIEDFQKQYTDAHISMRSVEAREAVSDFANDSVQVIVCARPFNKEERDALTAAKIVFQEYRVAMSAVAVIVNPAQPLDHLRVSELDSILTGSITRWNTKGSRQVIDLAIGGVNSSTNEVVKTTVLKGKPFALSATPYASSKELVDYVRRTPGALGIVGLNWLQGVGQEVTPVGLGTPGFSPDSTEAPGQYYKPVQAYVFQQYYPITTPVYIYSRETSVDVGLGFVSYVSSAAGQKIFLNDGLVPVTMPVRLVHLTSEQVKK